MRLFVVLCAVMGALVIGTPASADTTTFVSMTFNEPAHRDLLSGCPVFPEGFCGTGEVIPFGQATESIAFGTGCGGACDLRTISVAGGTLLLEEHIVGDCPGSCQPRPVEGGGTGRLTDVVVSGTGIFEGATGNLTGTVRGATSNARPAGASVVQLSGPIHYGP